MMSKAKRYVNAIYTIVLKTSITITILFKDAAITHKIEFIIIIVDITTSEEDTYLYNRIIFLCLLRFCVIFAITHFFVFSQLRLFLI